MHPPSGPTVSGLGAHDHLLRLLLEQVRDHAVFEIDEQGQLIGWNRSLQRVFGYSEEELAGAQLGLFLPPTQRSPEALADLLQAAQSRGRLELQRSFVRRSGQVFQGHCVMVPVDGAARMAVVIRDLSVLLATHDQLHALATSDQMTGLANRQHLFDLGRVEYRRWKRYRVPLSLLVLEVDRLSEITTGQSIEVADKIMRDIADILKESVRDVDLVARLDGGFFVGLLFSTPQEGAAILAERVRRNVNSTGFQLGYAPMHLSVSLAVLTANEAAADFDAFIVQAEQALAQAQAQGGDRILIA